MLHISEMNLNHYLLDMSWKIGFAGFFWVKMSPKICGRISRVYRSCSVSVKKKTHTKKQEVWSLQILIKPKSGVLKSTLSLEGRSLEF